MAGGLDNLKRGPIAPRNTEPGRAVIEANRAREEEIRNTASPDDIILDMMREASIAATKGLRKFNRKGGEPSRQVIEATKEARQLATVAAEIIRARGAATEAERFFAEMASRLSAANLGQGPQPVGEVPG